MIFSQGNYLWQSYDSSRSGCSLFLLLTPRSPDRDHRIAALTAKVSDLPEAIRLPVTTDGRTMR